MKASPAHRERHVLLFPTYGRREQGIWRVSIHGWAYVPVRSRFLYGLLSRYVRYKTQLPLNDLFVERTHRFFVKNDRGSHVEVDLPGQTCILEPTGPSGHFFGEPLVRCDDAEGTPRWIDVAAHVGRDRPAHGQGRIQLIPPRGLSVISDIDDTIKHSSVQRRGELLANTFLREFSAVPGIADRYRAWEAANTAFHYVSSSPWPLYPPLAEFFAAEGFPPGSFHLRTWNWRDARPFRFLSGQPSSKKHAIERILRSFPERKFVLIGDSGERDAELYGDIARRFPAQVVRILIRIVPEGSPSMERFLRAFRSLSSQTWRLFEDAEELPDADLLTSPVAAHRPR